MPADPVIVLGAGAIGSVYAVKLSARHPVTVVARQEHADAINAGGLRLIGRETVTALLSRFATEGLPHRIVVAFDEGDFAEIRPRSRGEA